MPAQSHPDDSLVLPPVYRPVRAAAGRGAFADACRRAANLGAGGFVHRLGPDLLDIAIVFEPEAPLASARRLLLLGVDALAATLVAVAPPGTLVAIAYPDAVTLNGVIVGGARLVAVPATPQDAVPDAVVLGLMVRIDAAAGEPGQWTRGSTLVEEGVEALDPAAFAELLSAHVLSGVDRWLTDGFDPIGRSVLARLGAAGGLNLRLDDAGALIDGTGQRVADLSAAAEIATWLDPATETPWL